MSKATAWHPDGAVSASLSTAGNSIVLLVLFADIAILAVVGAPEARLMFRLAHAEAFVEVGVPQVNPVTLTGKGFVF